MSENTEMLSYDTTIQVIQNDWSSSNSGSRCLSKPCAVLMVPRTGSAGLELVEWECIQSLRDILHTHEY